MRHDAERAVGRLPKSQGGTYVTTVLHKTGPRQWSEMKGFRLYSKTMKGTNYHVKIFKRAFPGAKVQGTGWGE